MSWLGSAVVVGLVPAQVVVPERERGEGGWGWVLVSFLSSEWLLPARPRRKERTLEGTIACNASCHFPPSLPPKSSLPPSELERHQQAATCLTYHDTCAYPRKVHTLCSRKRSCHSKQGCGRMWERLVASAFPFQSTAFVLHKTLLCRVGKNHTASRVSTPGRSMHKILPFPSLRAICWWMASPILVTVDQL